MTEHEWVVDPQHPLVIAVRDICLRFPEVSEVEAWGRPTFRAGSKIFVMVGAGLDEPLAVVVKPASADEGRAYLEREGFFFPRYWGARGWVAVPIDGVVSRQELAEIIDTSYRAVALVRQVRALDLLR